MQYRGFQKMATKQNQHNRNMMMAMGTRSYYCYIFVLFYITEYFNTTINYVTVTPFAVSAFSIVTLHNNQRNHCGRHDRQLLALQQHILGRKQQQQQQHQNFDYNRFRLSKTQLCMSGIGIATNYTWKEDAYEIELSVKVPHTTRTKDIRYKASSQSIDLRYKTKPASDINNVIDDDSNGDTEIVLLDGSRKLRGRINVDGTYWVLSDPLPSTSSHQAIAEEGTSKKYESYRQITVTMEKIIATPKDDFDIIDYDWKGIYHKEDDDEVSVRTYDAPEPFDVRQYAAEMGVDIDNLNMSMVDKTMFSSNLNITKSTLQTLHKAGYISSQEITQQKDGTEYVVNPDTGEPEIIDNQFHPKVSTVKKIPLIDTDTTLEDIESPPTAKVVGSTEPISTTQIPNCSNPSTDKVVQLKRNFTRAAFIEDQMKSNRTNTDNNPFRSTDDRSKNDENDPINALTVVRLKEILKSQGLKTSGTKSELQQRLRHQVNALLQQGGGGL
jgi:hypothetical protein